MTKLVDNLLARRVEETNLTAKTVAKLLKSGNFRFYKYAI